MNLSLPLSLTWESWLFNCQFGKFLEQALRDRLVCGLRSEQAQKKLLSMDDLDFKKALQTSQATEAAETRTKEMQGTPNVLWVDSPCYRCGKLHEAKSCPLIDSNIFFICPNHIRKMESKLHAITQEKRLSSSYTSVEVQWTILTILNSWTSWYMSVCLVFWARKN